MIPGVPKGEFRGCIFDCDGALADSLRNAKIMTALESKIHGCWMGKSIGGTLGLPVEGLLGPLSLTFYDPVPTIAPPNDDLELQLVWLSIIERSHGTLTASDFAKGWLDHIHYMWDEYGRCRWNLRRGISPQAAGAFENWFESGMGSPIRSEMWACLFPENPESAGYYAGLDASLDHGVEGIAGEVFFAVMQSHLASGMAIPAAIASALKVIPGRSETAHAIALVVEDFEGGIEAWESRRRLLHSYSHENFTHAPINVAIAVWALLHGDGDFEKSILLSTNAGYDTDSSTATVGASLGLAFGLEKIPGKWRDPIGEGVFVGPGIRDLDDAPKTLGELTRRVIAQIGKLEEKTLADVPWTPAVLPALEKLPGTIFMHPKGAGEAVPWANGELPAPIKEAGGASWKWEMTTDEPREIICLARMGMRLFVNGFLQIDCPPDLPYVPATHRSAAGSRVRINPGAGVHSVLLELNESDPAQAASVILAYPDLHICPWSRDELPARAELPVA